MKLAAIRLSVRLMSFCCIVALLAGCSALRLFTADYDSGSIINDAPVRGGKLFGGDVVLYSSDSSEQSILGTMNTKSGEETEEKEEAGGKQLDSEHGDKGSSARIELLTQADKFDTLFKAALINVSNMSILIADKETGFITTDWYVTERDDVMRYKLNIIVRKAEPWLSVSAVNQVKKGGVWYNVGENMELVEELRQNIMSSLDADANTSKHG